jgi:hypothetical protein
MSVSRLITRRIWPNERESLDPSHCKEKMVKDMYDFLVTLYQNVNVSHRMLFKNKLTGTYVSNNDTMASYMMKIIELRDHIIATGEKVHEGELVSITLNGFSSS